MLIFKLASRNLLRSRRRNALLSGLIIASISLLFVANAIFEGTDRGLQKSFVRSLTGDLVIAPVSPQAYGLFGSEVPIVSEYESLPVIQEFDRVVDRLASIDSIEAYAPLLTGAAQLSVAGHSVNTILMGIEPSAYFRVLDDLHVVSGSGQSMRPQGIMLNSGQARSIEVAIGRPLLDGEEMVLSMFSRGSFKLRRAFFTGVFEYASPTEVMERITLADPMLVRSLADYSMGSTYETIKVNTSSGSEDVFAEAADIQADEGSSFSLEALEETLSRTENRDSLVAANGGAWNFLLLRAKPGMEQKLALESQRVFSMGDSSCRVLSWKQAAGNSAQIIVVLQAVFYVGLGFIGLGAILVIMNALVISVMERIPEIGTMRSVGASSGFIVRLFIMESILLTMFSAIVGISVGTAITIALKESGIAIGNPLLVSLFGGRELHPILSMRAFVFHFLLAMSIAGLAWIYPVRIAMRIKPLVAMNR